MHQGCLRCQGGFCQLVLPHSSPASTNIRDNKGPLSKRERRLQKSRERDRATRLLQWVLKEEEYALLEENGDLVRLRVMKPKDVSSGGDRSSWVDGESVHLAQIEHRPALARLSFAEFTSGEGWELDDDGVIPSTSVKAPLQECPAALEAPSENGNEGDVLVCCVCFIVYQLMGQARTLLESYQSKDEWDEPENQAKTHNECINKDELKQSADQSATINLGDIEDLPSNIRKKSSTEGPNSSKWREHNQQQSSLVPRASFHGPIHLHNNNSSFAVGHSNSLGKGHKAASFVGKRDRTQMEENAKIHILVAESDEVSYYCR